MTYVSSFMTTPVVTDPDTQSAVSVLGGRVRTRAASADADGGFDVLEYDGERGHMSPLLLNKADEETVLILEGELSVEVGPQRLTVGPGGLALLPREQAHSLVVTSPQARILTPAHTGRPRPLRQPS
ncbi:hypothetical protein [Actinoplanes sp. M2I2]|uniref:hypothetical protein n=1 Tax=Actinoplanes sp. M2I2 TaxID=1734444 RepID=UPI0020204194|nr:hypothetical protein [Actinoplanes sp. M2I2]